MKFDISNAICHTYNSHENDSKEAFHSNHLYQTETKN